MTPRLSEVGEVTYACIDSMSVYDQRNEYSYIQDALVTHQSLSTEKLGDNTFGSVRLFGFVRPSLYKGTPDWSIVVLGFAKYSKSAMKHKTRQIYRCQSKVFVCIGNLLLFGQVAHKRSIMLLI